MNSVDLAADVAAIRASMARILMPGQQTELRVIHANKTITSSHFTDVDELSRAAATASDSGAYGVYFTPNPIAEDRSTYLATHRKATKDEDIDSSRWLLLDFDWDDRPKPSSATDHERHAILILRDEVESFLTDLQWPAPLQGDSGNGSHLMYRVEGAHSHLLKDVTNTLADLFDNDSVSIDRKVYNPSRIWKTYGTAARKGANTPERPWRLSSLTDKPGGLEAVTEAQLSDLADRHRRASDIVPSPVDIEEKADRLDEWLGEHHPNIGPRQTWRNAEGDGYRWIFDVCPWDETHRDRAAYVGLLGNGAISAKCHHNGCNGKNWQDLQDLAEEPFVSTNDPAPQAASTLNSPNRTDLGNAKRLVRQSMMDLRYAVLKGLWYYYDGCRWAIDHKDTTVTRHAKAAVGTIFAEANAAANAPARRALLSHAMRSESARSIKAMVTLAATEPEFEVEPSHLDGDPYLFNMSNGTMNLKTGILQSHDRTDLITKMSPIAFDPEATCPVWDEFLSYSFDNSPSIIRFFYRYFGYCLTGVTTEQVLLFMDGEGKNGKSTAFGALMYIMGEYAIQAPPGLLLSNAGTSHPTEQTDLEGVRFVACAEVDKGKRFDEATLKQLTGSDPIRARKMRQDYYQFAATHKFAIIANYKPIIKGNDTGIWRRILRLPWTKVVDDARRDKDLPNKLCKEAPGIFNRLLAGCLDWQQQGLQPPSTVQKATKGYRDEMDTLLEFFEDRCVLAPNASTSKATLHGSYLAWCTLRNERPASYNLFNRKIDERGFESKLIRTGGSVNRSWLGISVISLTDPIDINPKRPESDNLTPKTLGEFREMN